MHLLNDLHWVHAARGELAPAGEALGEAIEGWERIGDRAMLADSLNGAVLLATLRGDFDDALAVADRGRELARLLLACGIAVFVLQSVLAKRFTNRMGHRVLSMEELVCGLAIIHYREGWLADGRHDAVIVAERGS